MEEYSIHSESMEQNFFPNILQRIDSWRSEAWEACD